MLEENLDKLHAMADALMLYETIDADQIDDTDQIDPHRNFNISRYFGADRFLIYTIGKSEITFSGRDLYGTDFAHMFEG